MATSGKASGPERISDVLDELSLRDDKSRNTLKRQIRVFVQHKFDNDKDVIAHLNDAQIQETSANYLSIHERGSAVLWPALQSLHRDHVAFLIYKIMKLQSSHLRMNLSQKKRVEHKTNEMDSMPLPQHGVNAADTTSDQRPAVDNSTTEETASDYDNYVPSRRQRHGIRSTSRRLSSAGPQKRGTDLTESTPSKRLRKEHDGSIDTAHTRSCTNNNSSSSNEDEWVKHLHLYLRACKYDITRDLSNLTLLPVQNLLPISSLSCDGSLAPQMAISCRKAHFTIQHCEYVTDNELFIIKKSLYHPDLSTETNVYEMVRKKFTPTMAEEPFLGWHFDSVNREEEITVTGGNQRYEGQLEASRAAPSNKGLNGHRHIAEILPYRHNVSSPDRQARVDEAVTVQQKASAEGITAPVLPTSTEVSNPPRAVSEGARVSNLSMSTIACVDVAEIPGVDNDRIATDSLPTSHHPRRSAPPTPYVESLTRTSILPIHSWPPPNSAEILCTDPNHLGVNDAYHMSESHIMKTTDKVEFWRIMLRDLMQQRSRAIKRQDVNALEILAPKQVVIDAAVDLFSMLEGPIAALTELRCIVVDIGS